MPRSAGWFGLELAWPNGWRKSRIARTQRVWSSTRQRRGSSHGPRRKSAARNQTVSSSRLLKSKSAEAVKQIEGRSRLTQAKACIHPVIIRVVNRIPNNTSRNKLINRHIITYTDFYVVINYRIYSAQLPIPLRRGGRARVDPRELPSFVKRAWEARTRGRGKG